MVSACWNMLYTEQTGTKTAVDSPAWPVKQRRISSRCPRVISKVSNIFCNNLFSLCIVSTFLLYFESNKYCTVVHSGQQYKDI